MGRRQGRRARVALLALLATGAALHFFGARAAVAVIDLYRAHVSPAASAVVTCRFKPTCSVYGRAAYLRYGFWRGTAKTAWRIGRCGPWTKMGTADEP